MEDFWYIRFFLISFVLRLFMVFTGFPSLLAIVSTVFDFSCFDFSVMVVLSII